MKPLKMNVQFRYSTVSPDCHMLALLGSLWIREYGNTNILHFHNFLEVGHCLEGGGTMDFGDYKAPYTKGSFTIIPPKFPHETNSSPGKKCHWEFLFIDVDSILSEQFPDLPHVRAQLKRQIFSDALVFQHDDYPQIASIILSIIDEHRSKANFYIDNAKGMLRSLMIFLSRLSDNESEEPITSSQLASIAAGIEYVEKHYNEKITISMLAKACHISETHFRRLFMQLMNTSPQAYINRIRIDEACKLLRTTGKTISDISTMVGFNTISSLNRSFKQIVKMSPSEYRNGTHL